MKKFFDQLFYANSKCKFVKKESKKQKFKNQPFVIITLILLVLCLIVAANLCVAGYEPLNNAVMHQFILIGFEASARLLYSDLKRRLEEDPEKHKSQKNSPVGTYLWLALEVLILCTIGVAVSCILVHLAPYSPSTHLKTLEG